VNGRVTGVSLGVSLGQDAKSTGGKRKARTVVAYCADCFAQSFTI
jgi:hypothetical protein